MSCSTICVCTLYLLYIFLFFFFFSSRRRHTRYIGDWSSDVCSSDLHGRVIRRGELGGVESELNVAAAADDASVRRRARSDQIGRASCRERVWRWGGGGEGKKKK